jgi:hypothetical protein
MKKCKGCEKEIDKYAIACQYCGRLLESHDPKETMKKAGHDGSAGKNAKNKNGQI